MIKNNLSEISNPVAAELKKFNQLFSKSIKSDVFLVDLIARYILKQKGKKIRPTLVFLSSKVVGDVTDKSFRGAIMVELLHTATLIHDDVVDAAEKRRGLPSINAVWKNKVAVLMGDYLLSKGLSAAVNGEDFEYLKIVTNTVKRMSEGELLQINKTRKLDIDEPTYFRIISDKTASLLSTCSEFGAIGASADPEIHKAFRDYGEYLGIAFQIRDDILDYIGKSSIIGKPRGGDIREKKITLPLIYSLSKNKNKANEIIKKLKSRGKKNSVEDIIKFVEDSGGIEYADLIAKEYAEKAKNCLSRFNDSDSKEALLKLVDFVIQRKN